LFIILLKIKRKLHDTFMWIIKKIIELNEIIDVLIIKISQFPKWVVCIPVIDDNIVDYIPVNDLTLNKNLDYKKKKEFTLLINCLNKLQ
jgi:hypothetical protein